jgi:HEAT repeat protein
MLAAIADAPRTARVSSLLVRLSAETGGSVEETELLAWATAKQIEVRLIPKLVALLSRRAGREAVRSALVTLGDAAFDEIWRTLTDDSTAPRMLRLHLPKTLARFGTPTAVEYLLRSIETEGDRLVRYKSIRALEAIVDQHSIRVDRARVERLAHANLVEHFQALGSRTVLEATGSAAAATTASRRLLLGLLDDKLRQALERTFRLLKIAYPKQQIRRAYLACLSEDSYARANAVEFLDALLRHPHQEELRQLLCLAADDLPAAERLSRASILMVAPVPSTPEQALVRLAEEGDVTVATLATLYAAELEQPSLRLKDSVALRERADISTCEDQALGALLPAGAGHA